MSENHSLDADLGRYSVTARTVLGSNGPMKRLGELALYTAATASALALAPGAEAAIIYSGARNITVQRLTDAPNGGSADLNGDGLEDLGFIVSSRAGVSGDRDVALASGLSDRVLFFNDVRYGMARFDASTRNISADPGAGISLNRQVYMRSHTATAASLHSSVSGLWNPDPAKAKAAYDWISMQLCCTDIRAAYVNLNISPGIWLAQLRQLTYDASKIPGSSAEAFAAMKDQLAKEFQYVTLVRLFQSNLVGLFQDQQANISLLFQDDFDKVENSLQIGLGTKAHSASWTAILENVFSVGSSLLNMVPGDEEVGIGADVIAQGVEVALAIASAAASEATEHTNTPAGTPIQGEEREEVAAGNMADKLASNFAATLVSMGDSFDRIVSDWGRLKTLGAPLLANLIPWDSSTSGLMLRAFDRSIQRELYARLYAVNYVVQNFPYVGHDYLWKQTYGTDGDLCPWPDYHKKYRALIWYPNSRVNDDHDDGERNRYPHHYQWGIWALTLSKDKDHHCPGEHGDAYPVNTGLFAPMDPGDPNTLGAYRYWFFTRNDFTIDISNDQQPCYDASC